MMQTEISFLLSLILDEELSPKVQKLCRKRIKEIETGLLFKPPKIQQAPSTQRLLDAPPPVIPPVTAKAGEEVVTGIGTRGPKKW